MKMTAIHQIISYINIRILPNSNSLRWSACLLIGMFFLVEFAYLPSLLSGDSFMEIWKPIVGYEGYYEVSNMGSVRSVDRVIENVNGVKTFIRGKILRQACNYVGYYSVDLNKKGRGLMQRVSRLVAKAFLPNPGCCPSVNHKDGVKSNNSANNLEWCSHSHNTIHAYKNGLMKNAGYKSGERHHNSILTKIQVVEIRKRFKRGEMAISIAKDYQINPKSLSDIKLGKTWRGVV